jgi:hypothetical protein
MSFGQRVLAFACAVEAVTGLGLVVAPALVAKLLLGAGLEGVAAVVGQVAGIGLIALAIACWPQAGNNRAYAGMLIYGALNALLLAEAGSTGSASGTLLWPAVIFHGVMSALLAVAWASSRRSAVAHAWAQQSGTI